MAMPQRDDLIEGIKRTDLLLEWAVQHGDEADDVATPVTPTITQKKSAVKVEMTVEAPSGKDSQFFRVDFGE